MNTEAKINTVAAILKELIISMDPEDILAIRRYNMLKDLDRILNDGHEKELVEDGFDLHCSNTEVTC